MNDLEKLQNEFIDGVYDGSKTRILSSVKDGKAPREELFDIYRNNIRMILRTALEITYPKVLNFVGAKKFGEFSDEAIKQSRSNTGNLDDYGENFFKVFLTKKEYFLSDLAKLEWCKQKAYLAPNVDLIDVAKLQSLQQEKLFTVKFDLNPSCFLIISSYNLLSTKKQNKALKNLNYFVIYRHDLETKVEKVSKGEFNFLLGVQDGLDLYQIYSKYRPNIGSCLSKYLANGLLSGFKS